MPAAGMQIEAPQFEKLGSFYLGRQVDASDPKAEDPSSCTTPGISRRTLWPSA